MGYTTFDLLAAAIAALEEEAGLDHAGRSGRSSGGRRCRPVSRAYTARGVSGRVLSARGPGILRELTIVSGGEPSILLSVDGSTERITWSDAVSLSQYSSWLDALEEDSKRILVLSNIRFYRGIEVVVSAESDVAVRVEYLECSGDTGVAEEDSGP